MPRTKRGNRKYIKRNTKLGTSTRKGATSQAVQIYQNQKQINRIEKRLTDTYDRNWYKAHHNYSSLGWPGTCFPLIDPSKLVGIFNTQPTAHANYSNKAKLTSLTFEGIVQTANLFNAQVIQVDMYVVKLRKATATNTVRSLGPDMANLLTDHLNLIPPKIELEQNQIYFDLNGTASEESPAAPMLNPKVFRIMAQRHFMLGDRAFTNSVNEGTVTNIGDANKKFKFQFNGLDIDLNPGVNKERATFGSTGYSGRTWKDMSSDDVPDTEQLYFLMFHNGHVQITVEPPNITRSHVFFNGVSRAQVAQAR